MGDKEVFLPLAFAPDHRLIHRSGSGKGLQAIIKFEDDCTVFFGNSTLFLFGQVYLNLLRSERNPVHR